MLGPVLRLRPFTESRFETGVTFQDVSTGASDSDHDACPNCGARVESAISAPGEPVREAMHGAVCLQGLTAGSRR
jgi:predicted RNA-binding Zn ribbon-like protein